VCHSYLCKTKESVNKITNLLGGFDANWSNWQRPPKGGCPDHGKEAKVLLLY